MGLPVRPRIPAAPVSLHVDGLHAVLTKVRSWTRLTTLAMVATAGGGLYLALRGDLSWLVAVPLIAAPYLPIAAGTRAEEAVRLIEDQVRDAALRGPPAVPR